ncbi:MAG: family 10 glycosylhydrolase [Prevotella sp.]|nr:family 10 glycosylhydrolase [Prevotella sp.]
MRAVWLTTIGGIDWPHTYANSPGSIAKQKRELTTILDQLRQAGINTVLIQTRVRATTIFPCPMEPWDGCLSGKPGTSPGYDALQFCIDECHKRGMQCHAWIVTIPVGKWNTYGCKLLRQKYPKLIVKIGEEGYMNPEMAETGDYLARFCREVTRRYDVDGIHLDYIRYPETWKLKVTRQQGRQHITSIVRKIQQAVKAEKPWVMLSCSPIGKYDDLSRYKSGGWNANTTVCQDAQGWLREGLMDALMPMMYFQGNNFFPFVVNWKEFAYGRIVAPGLAVYMLHPKERNWGLDIIQRELYVLREQGLGHTFFRSKFLTDNTKGVYSFTKDFNQTPALIPPMSWARKQPPIAPRNLSIRRSISMDALSWNGARDLSGADYLLYNIYASEAYPVDISDSRHLIATRQRNTSLRVNHGGKTLNYAVTATDRYGNESQPVMTVRAAVNNRQKLDFRQLIMGKSSKRNKKH